jgi:hypothetical protein
MTRQEKRKETIENGKRLAVILIAIKDEITRFNQSAHKNPIIIETAFGNHFVDGCTFEHWYQAYPQNVSPNMYNRRTFMGCNDCRWSDMLKKAGVQRNQLFSQY